MFVQRDGRGEEDETPRVEGADDSLHPPEAHHMPDIPSDFVSKVVESLRFGESDTAQGLFEGMQQRQVATPRELASLVDSLQDQRDILLLTHVYEQLYNDCSAEELAESLPALVSLVHASLTAEDIGALPTDAEGPNGCQLKEIVETVLQSLTEDDQFARIAGAGITDRELELLAQVARSGRVDQPGYLGAIEMLWYFRPDTYSLQIFVDTLGRIPSLPEMSEVAVKEMAVRHVSEFARHDFEKSFTVLARALGDSRSSQLAQRVYAVAEGFSSRASHHVDFLVSMIQSEELNLRIFALKVIHFAGRQSEDGLFRLERALTLDERGKLSDSILRACSSYLNGSVEISRSLVLAALASISSDQDDLKLARDELQAIVARGDIPSPQLCECVVRGAQRGLNGKPIVRFEQLDVPCEERLSLSARELYPSEEDPALEPLDQADYEYLAREIAASNSFEEVLHACSLYAAPIDRSKATPRPSASRVLFSGVEEATSFLIWYRELCGQGPHRFAVELFPECLSALLSLENNYSFSAAPIRELSTILVNKQEDIPGAVSRLNDLDIYFLTNFARGYGGVRSTVAGLDLLLATYQLRAALAGAIPGDRLQWQQELVGLWSDLSTSVRESKHYRSLARISAISEMRTEGSALELLKLVPLRGTFDRELFSAFALGLTVRPAAVARTILALVNSESGYDLARGFFLSQLLPCYLEESQGNHVLKMARNSLSEPGALSLDAMCTIGALSSSPTDVGMLLKSQPSIGVDRSLHDATAVAAATEILSVVRHTTGGY